MDAATILSLVTIALALFVCIKYRPKHRGVGDLPAPSEEVWAAMRRHEKIAAIRAYRQQTHASLRLTSRCSGPGRHKVLGRGRPLNLAVRLSSIGNRKLS